MRCYFEYASQRIQGRFEIWKQVLTKHFRVSGMLHKRNFSNIAADTVALTKTASKLRGLSHRCRI